MHTQKHILIYGDSNTWGYTPGTGRRMPADIRWPGALRKLLPDDYTIIEEGLCGRTTVWDDPFAPGIERNGMKTVSAVLDSHKPLDMVVIFLGTNDLKQHFNVTPDGIAKGVENLVAAARVPAFGPGNGRPPAVIAICPCPILEVRNPAPSFGDCFTGGGKTSRELRNSFARMHRRCGAEILYAEDFAASDPADGIHLSQESHAAIALETAKRILECFEKEKK